jgi:beta-lactam-binding protein with PASTA domain
MRMSFREQLRRLDRLFLLLFVLGSAAFLSAITGMRLAIVGREVTVPNLVGRSLNDAERELGALGLSLIIADHEYSSVPAGAVVRQNPPPGMPVKVGQRVQVVLSLGPQNVTVPSLVDLTLRAAQLRLLTAGLQLGEVSYLYTAQQPAGFVIQQDPPAGTAGVSSLRVSVLVSQGTRPAAFVMPDAVGQAAGQVQQRLRQAGVAVKLVSVEAGGIEPGRVVGQQPPAGARLDAGATVVLQVAASVRTPPKNSEAPASPVLKSATTARR